MGTVPQAYRTAEKIAVSIGSTALFKNDNVLPFRNDSGATVPAYGIMKITGAISINDQLVLTCDKPDANDLDNPAAFVFNSQSAVANGVYGKCVIRPPALALFDATAGTTSVGGEVGPESASWYLSVDGLGFRTRCIDEADTVNESATKYTILADSTGGGRGILQVEFTVDSLTDPGGGADIQATVTVTAIPAGMTTVPLLTGSCKLTVYDQLGCFFDESPLSDIVGRAGTAHYVQNLDASCDPDGDPLWSVNGLCCPPE